MKIYVPNYYDVYCGFAFKTQEEVKDFIASSDAWKGATFQELDLVEDSHALIRATILNKLTPAERLFLGL